MRKDTVYSQEDPRVREVLDLHQKAVGAVQAILQRIPENQDAWTIDECKALVAELDQMLRKNPRVLIGVCRQPRHDLDAGELGAMLAYHGVDCSVAMLCLLRAAAEPEDRVLLAGLSGLVQNFGMALLPSEIVSKRGKLTAHEANLVREHPLLGSKIAQIAANPELAEIVSQSHERMDGSGYPVGLKGAEINRVALFLHAVDVFEALTHSRTYRHTETAYSAMKVINMVRESSLDPAAVRSLINFFTVYPIGSLVELNTRERGKVVDINPGELLRPVVATLVSSTGKPCSPASVIDLSKQSHLYIVRVVEDPELEALGAGLY